MGRRESKCSWERFLESDNGIFDNNDTISRLPKTVLHHVVSFLPTLEKDQVRFLSRKWRRIAAQSQKKLSLTRHRLDEQELSRILADDFHSVDILSLTRCSGMRTLKLVNFNLKTIELNCCGLKILELNTLHLETFRFLGPHYEAMQNRVWYLQKARNDGFNWGCHEQHDVYGSQQNFPPSSMLNSNEICSFSNMNVGRLFLAEIELYPRRYQKRKYIWFRNLNEMLRYLKAKTVAIETNFGKNIIIPKQLRQNLMPLLDETDVVSVEITSRTRDTIDLVDLADLMLWISPRLKYLTVILQGLSLSRLTVPFQTSKINANSFNNNTSNYCYSNLS
nr:F-box domain, cyclin-like protein [Tanacetum cinerariifolium]